MFDPHLRWLSFIWLAGWPSDWLIEPPQVGLCFGGQSSEEADQSSNLSPFSCLSGMKGEKSWSLSYLLCYLHWFHVHPHCSLKCSFEPLICVLRQPLFYLVSNSQIESTFSVLLLESTELDVQGIFFLQWTFFLCFFMLMVSYNFKSKCSFSSSCLCRPVLAPTRHYLLACLHHNRSLWWNEYK